MIIVDGGSLSAGTLEGTAGTVRISDPVGGTALTVGGTSNFTFSGNISDNATSGSVVKVGTGSWTLGGSNSYTGGSTINAGSIIAGGTGTLPANGPVTVNSTAARGLDLAGSNATIGALSGTGNVGSSSGSPTLTVGADNGTSSFSGQIKDATRLVKAGSGKLTLSGSSSYTGGTTIQGGTLSVNADAALGTPPAAPATNVTFSGNGTLQAGAAGVSLSGNRNVAVSSGATATFATQGNALAVPGVISGPGGLAKVGSGVLTLTGSNTYSGGTEIDSGILNINADAAFGAAPATPATNITFAGDAELQAAAAAMTLSANRNVAVDGGATATVDTQGNTLAIPGVVSGGGGLTKIGTGTLTLSGSNNYGGSTTVAAGTLTIAAGALSHNSDVSITGGKLDLSGGTNAAQSLTLGGGSLALALSGTPSAALGDAGRRLEPDRRERHDQRERHRRPGQRGPLQARPGRLDLARRRPERRALPLTSITGGIDANYALVANGTELDLQERARQQFSNSSPAFSIITGGTTTVSATLTNTALAGSLALGVSLADNGGSGGTVSSFNSSSGPTVAGGAAGSTISGTFTAGAVGLGQTWSVKNTDSRAYSNTAGGTGSVNVYNHATINGYTGETISLGRIHAGGSASGVSITNGSAGDTRVALMSNSPSNGYVSIIGLSNVQPGQSGHLVATLANAQAAGPFSVTLSMIFGDSSTLPGHSDSAAGTEQVTVMGNVCTGLGTWTSTAGGNWDDFSKWDTYGGVPGLDPAFNLGQDTAAFGVGSAGTR